MTKKFDLNKTHYERMYSEPISPFIQAAEYLITPLLSPKIEHSPDSSLGELKSRNVDAF
jgi:hypothetical protein